MEYNQHNIAVGDLVRATDETEWGTVTEVAAKHVKADYTDGNYTMEYWVIEEVNTQSGNVPSTQQHVNAFGSTWDGSGFPPVGAVVVGRDSNRYRVDRILRKNIAVTRESDGRVLRGTPGFFSPTTDQTFNPASSTVAAAATSPAAIRPGMIVLYSGKNGKQSKNRLWVVLSDTKNSQGRDVNICPVNPDNTFPYRYLRTPKTALTPVAVKTEKPEKKS